MESTSLGERASDANEDSLGLLDTIRLKIFQCNKLSLHAAICLCGKELVYTAISTRPEFRSREYWEIAEHHGIDLAYDFLQWDWSSAAAHDRRKWRAHLPNHHLASSSDHHKGGSPINNSATKDDDEKTQFMQILYSSPFLDDDDVEVSGIEAYDPDPNIEETLKLPLHATNGQECYAVEVDTGRLRLPPTRTPDTLKLIHLGVLTKRRAETSGDSRIECFQPLSAEFLSTSARYNGAIKIDMEGQGTGRAIHTEQSPSKTELSGVNSAQIAQIPEKAGKATPMNASCSPDDIVEDYRVHNAYTPPASVPSNVTTGSSGSSAAKSPFSTTFAGFTLGRILKRSGDHNSDTPRYMETKYLLVAGLDPLTGYIDNHYALKWPTNGKSKGPTLYGLEHDEDDVAGIWYAKDVRWRELSSRTVHLCHVKLENGRLTLAWD